MTVKFGIQNTQFKAKLADLATIQKIVMPQLEKEFLKNTPVKTGNARANTSLQGNVIEADYPYAFVLDAGRGFRDGQMRGSEQAPDGMSEPTKEFAKKLIPQVVQQLARKR
jgi:hypothetical protein